MLGSAFLSKSLSIGWQKVGLKFLNRVTSKATATTCDTKADLVLAKAYTGHWVLPVQGHTDAFTCSTRLIVNELQVDCFLPLKLPPTSPLDSRKNRLGYQLGIVWRPTFSVQEQADDRRRCPVSGHVEWRHADGILNVEVGLLLQKPFDSSSLSYLWFKVSTHPFHCTECQLSRHPQLPCLQLDGEAETLVDVLYIRLRPAAKEPKQHQLLGRLRSSTGETGSKERHKSSDHLDVNRTVVKSAENNASAWLRSRRMTSLCPSSAAWWSGVSPSLFFTLGSALLSKRRRTTFTSPLLASIC